MIHKISFCFILLLVLSCSAQRSAAQKNNAYLFSYFKGNGEDGLHLACSNDGLKWTSLKNDGAFLTPVTGKDKLMRDPCLFAGPDGTFRLVWTISWNEKGIGYASSKDLINWSEQKYIPVMEHESGARNCWAPEITYDPKTGLYMIYWATTIPGRFPQTESAKENSYNHRMYYVTTKDFKTFSKTALLYDPGFNVIDASIALDGKRFVMFLKDETPEPPQKNIRVAFSDKLTGPYSQPSKPITGNYWAEGPTAMKMNGYWYVYFDKYRDRKYGAVRSGDLQNWEDVSETISFPEGARHGSVLKVSEKIIENLKKEIAIDTKVFDDALANGKLVNEGFNRCINYVNGWIKYADPVTGLIPRNLTDSKDYWNAWDAAADNYPFMVLTSSILMPEFFKKTALNILNTEKTITSRIGKLPDTYSFSKKGFKNDIIDTSQIIFGSAEYMKDGLIPITEWLGQSPWSDRMLDILNDLPLLVRVVKQIKGSFYGNSAIVEINGDLLQVLARMYWFTGKREYLEWGAEIADYYLNDERLPTIGLARLRIRDHGCEIISGLCEVYLAAYYSWPEKYRQWKKPIHKMLDRVLEVGRNEDGLFYNEINPKTGEVISSGLSDTFGYTFNAYYFVSRIDSVPAYWDAVIVALNSLNLKYRNYNWENGGCDGYADAIEGALNLYNREPLPSVSEWLNSEIRVMWNYQKPDGVIEGWHGDGNFARTTIMYCLWKTQGLIPAPWNSKLILGSTFADNTLNVALSCGTNWTGRIKFDSPRFRDKMHLPVDYPRINQYQQWFTVEPERTYSVSFAQTGITQIFMGKDLIEGLPVTVRPGETLLLNIREIETTR